MAIRKIIQINEEKCNGCGLCIPNCAEGALMIIDGKVKVVKDSFCDGLGACLGHCPQDALKIIEREAADFDEEEVMKHIKGAKHSPVAPAPVIEKEKVKIKSQLQNWPVQLNLVSPGAPYFKNADLLVAADCVSFAYSNFHLELLKGKVLVIGCPKLDDASSYEEKLTEIIERNNINSIAVAHMEVPCCMGIVRAVDIAVRDSGKNVPVKRVKIGIGGQSANE